MMSACRIGLHRDVRRARKQARWARVRCGVMIVLLFVLLAFVCGCESIPVSATYTGTLGGHAYSASYSSGKGVVLTYSGK